MKIRVLTISILGLLALSSCRSSRNLAANTSNTPAAPAKIKSTAKREFLNGIQVTPGYAVTSTHKTGNTNKSVEPAVKVNNSKKTNTDNTLAGNIESANLLQIKYAIATDATVEKLTNIPLLEVIDKWWGTRYCMGGVTDN